MKTKKNHIPLKDYKLLLVQLIAGLTERLEDTGLKPTSKRNKLTKEAQGVISKLYREFRRDATYKEMAHAKEDIYQTMFKEQKIPRWMFLTIMEVLCEEQYKMVHK